MWQMIVGAQSARRTRTRRCKWRIARAAPERVSILAGSICIDLEGPRRSAQQPQPGRQDHEEACSAVARSVVPVLALGFVGVGLWSASDQLLAPSWRGVEKNLSVCAPETEAHWGAQCGNLRATHHIRFNEVHIPLNSGQALPGWLIKTEDNNLGPARGVILLVHAGGSDRREETRYIPFYLRQGLDVLTFDYACHGEAPCPSYGLTYGQRESQDVLAAYRYASNTYRSVDVFGSSVGAASILMALPDMPTPAA
jgi:uncharacterized protein